MPRTGSAAKTSGRVVTRRTHTYDGERAAMRAVAGLVAVVLSAGRAAGPLPRYALHAHEEVVRIGGPELALAGSGRR